MALAAKLENMLGDDAYVERGEKRQAVETFAELWTG